MSTRADRAAEHAVVAVRKLVALANAHGPGLQQEDLVDDTKTTALYNDIRYITLQAEAKGTVKAVWVADINDKGQRIYEPRPDLSNEVLSACEYHIVVYRTGLEDQYQHLLRLEWPRWERKPEKRYTGTVEKPPRWNQLGQIKSKGQVNGLLRRDVYKGEVQRLVVGDHVEFSVVQRKEEGTPKVIAFLVTKVSGSHDDWLLGYEGV